jgi:catechol 2,3-dioxygenase-like lactoylglutathione lyase family enzyme
MIAYATIGTNTFEASALFFDAVFGALGYTRVHDYSEGGWIGYGSASQKDDATATLVWLCKPFNGAPASAGNGAMVSVFAKTRAQVDAFHAAALAHGGASEGAPGLREAYGPNMYLAYIRDTQGNKFSAVCRAAA